MRGFADLLLVREGTGDKTSLTFALLFVLLLLLLLFVVLLLVCCFRAGGEQLKGRGEGRLHR